MKCKTFMEVGAGFSYKTLIAAKYQVPLNTLYIWVKNKEKITVAYESLYHYYHPLIGNLDN